MESVSVFGVGEAKALPALEAKSRAAQRAARALAGPHDQLAPLYHAFAERGNTAILMLRRKPAG